MTKLLKDPDYLYIICYCVEIYRTLYDKSGLESYTAVRDIFMPTIQSHWQAYMHDYDALIEDMKKVFNNY